MKKTGSSTVVSTFNADIAGKIYQGTSGTSSAVPCVNVPELALLVFQFLPISRQQTQVCIRPCCIGYHSIMHRTGKYVYYNDLFSL